MARSHGPDAADPDAESAPEDSAHPGGAVEHVDGELTSGPSPGVGGSELRGRSSDPQHPTPTEDARKLLAAELAAGSLSAAGEGEGLLTARRVMIAALVAALLLLGTGPLWLLDGPSQTGRQAALSYSQYLRGEQDLSSSALTSLQDQMTVDVRVDGARLLSFDGERGCWQLIVTDDSPPVGPVQVDAEQCRP